jgi:nitrogen fixation protein FixH
LPKKTNLKGIETLGINKKILSLLFIISLIMTGCQNENAKSEDVFKEEVKNEKSQYKYTLAIDGDLKVDEDVTFNVTVKDKNDKPVKGGKVEIELLMENMGHSGRMITKKTDDGQFESLAAPPMEGEWLCYIYYLKGGKEDKSGMYKFNVQE